MTNPRLKRNAMTLLITEKEFQATVRELAELRGWKVFTTWNSRHSPAGEPDLRLVHPTKGRMVWAELKREGGRLTELQREAIEILKEAGQEVYVWFPSSWASIEATLE